ncbi:MAG: VWA domain-containing protein [Cellvibrionaceae bacterium]
MTDNKDSKKLQKSSRQDINAFLGKVNQLSTKPQQKRGRLIFAIDATASRQPTWDTACHIQSDMFSSTTLLGGIETQLCYYKGFNEFYASPWINQTSQLQKLMSSVSCAAGHTQITKILNHGLIENKKSKIKGIVFIGDTIEESADNLCNIAGQLGLQSVPVFIFHEKSNAGFHINPNAVPNEENVFRQIARLSGGAYCPFDLSSAKTLGELLSAVAVYASGGRKALIKLKEESSNAAQLLLDQLK